MPTVAELMKALPSYADLAAEDVQPEFPAVPELSHRPVPVGRLRRMGLLATLQSQIAAAYLFYWIRGWFKNAAERERLLAETHWKTAVAVLDSMSYLRGATMKVGQMLGSFPDIVPAEFVETLEQLHFNAPPMHFSLLREMVANELSDDPENVFASFERRAFAAASLGQVHRARLKSGEEAAVKIQYPGIARTIADDFRNLSLVLLPGRRGPDWESARDQFDDLRMRIDRETDYQREAQTLQTVRSLFREEDGIVVPRVFTELSTRRVLTMEHLDGVHVEQFLATNPSQEVRNEYARKMTRAWYRMLYAGRLLYLDFNPGNFLFMDDGRLGLIDFGCMMEIDDAMWETFRRMDRPLTTGDRAERLAVLTEWADIGDDAANAERLRVMDAYGEWTWRPRFHGGPFDFGDEADLRRGIDLFVEMVRRRYTRGKPSSPMMTRHQFGWRAILYMLKAKIEIAPIAEEEVRATGWDRRDYALPT